MSIIILGATGMLGRYTSSFLGNHHDCINLTRKDFDATESVEHFNDIIHHDDIVINCVGVLKPYIDSIGIANTIKINSVFPQLIADICSKKKAQFIHISSDCIFSGEKGQYVEDDISDAKDIYAKTKSIEPPNALTLRTSFIGEDINDDGVGFLQWIISQRDKTINGFDNCLWNGVTCLQLVKTISDIIEYTRRWISAVSTYRLWTGCRHIFTPHIISKYDLCGLVNDIYNLNITVDRCTAKSITGTKINGIMNRSLSTKHSIYSMPTLRDQIIEQKNYELS